MLYSLVSTMTDNDTKAFIEGLGMRFNQQLSIDSGKLVASSA
jgi:hypothetical protein